MLHVDPINVLYNRMSKSITSQPGDFFSKLRNIFWPIKKEELPKFLSSSFLMFSILMIQNIIRALKDSVINVKISTEITSFLKFWGVMPASLLMTLIYVTMVNRMSPQKVFYVILGTFISFFALFGFVIFPMNEELHMTQESINYITMLYPHLKWFIYLYANWGFSLFYVITELWPNLAFALLFWQFINNITNVEESKRFYPLYGLLGQTSLFISGMFLSSILPSLTNYFTSIGDIREHVHMKIAMTLIVIMGSFAIATFWFINTKILTDADSIKFKTKESNVSLKQSLKMIVSSRYIRLITILLFCYGMSVNLVEGPWKAKAREVYHTTEEYASFVGTYLSGTGIITIIFVLFCSNMVRKFGWLSTAIITPIMMLITGTVFFVFSNFSEFASNIVGYFMIYSAPIYIAVFVGAIQNILIKSSKYTLFDSTKEMSYVPLDNELKTKGKAAADMIGVKFGKSIGAFLPMFIFSIFPSMTYNTISIYLMAVFIFICIIWLYATIALGKEYNAISK
jgi:AAA family ATP:ADP antiporter